MFERKSEQYAENTIENWNYKFSDEIEHKVKQIWQDGAKFGYQKANEWHFIKDCLPPEPECKGDILKPLDYICAYKLKDGGYETDFFSYYGNGEFLGENKEYPIYAWLEHPICVPEPPKEQE